MSADRYTVSIVGLADSIALTDEEAKKVALAVTLAEVQMNPAEHHALKALLRPSRRRPSST